MVLQPIQQYVKFLLDKIPPGILVHKDSTLTAVEKVLCDTIESKIYPYTHYEPIIDNKDDRGEVKSLAFIAVKGYNPEHKGNNCYNILTAFC